MVNLLTDIGEEWYTEESLNGATVEVGLYDDSTDALTDSSDVADVSTEPTGSNYDRQSDTVTTAQINGDFGITNDSQIAFDVSDSSQTVDAGFIVVNFQSDEVAGDSGATDHLVAAGDLTQSRDLSQIDTLNIDSGNLEVSLD